MSFKKYGDAEKPLSKPIDPKDLKKPEEEKKETKEEKK